MSFFVKLMNGALLAVTAFKDVFSGCRLSDITDFLNAVARILEAMM
ncbi:hypothetical protein [Microvirgula aerodenitrificans]|nr:hypothetical protein [Microvirgula aerodenitrificans]